MSSSFYLSLNIEYECSQMYEHQLINDIIISYDKQVTMFFNKLFMGSNGMEYLPKMNYHTMHSPYALFF
jgi:hypothetical protein